MCKYKLLLSIILTVVSLNKAENKIVQYPEFVQHSGAPTPNEYINRFKNINKDVVDTKDSNVLIDLLRIHREADASSFLHNARNASLDLSPKCNRDWTRYKLALSTAGTENGTFLFPFWAGRMFDSTGFVEPGIMDGNFLFEGRYSECARAKVVADVDINTVQGMYCLAYWYQRYTYLEWQKRGQGICVPDSCSDDDVWELLYNVYQPNFDSDNYAYQDLHCERGKPELKSDPEAIISIIILSLFGLLVVVATIYHHYVVEIEGDDVTIQAKPIHKGKVTPASDDNMETYLEPKPEEVNEVNEGGNGEINPGFAVENGEKPFELKNMKNENSDNMVNNSEAEQPSSDVSKVVYKKKRMSTLNVFERLLLAFSMYITVPILSSSKQPKGAYRCLNGLRFLAMAWIILGHTYSLGTMDWPPIIENGYIGIANVLKAGYMKIITLDVYVDTFFVLSAFLMTVSLLRKFDKKGGNLGLFGWFMHFFGRYWRLTPTYFIILMVYSNLWHYFGEGPFMKQYVGDADSCQSAWWVNLLYINNLYQGHGWCFGWSWYLCCDWQFYCMAPVFLYVLWRWEKFGLVLNIAGLCGGIIASLVLVYKFSEQGPDTPDDERISDFFDIYIVPWTRCPVYFMGMLLGWLFYKTDGNIKMNKVVVFIGWIVALAMFGMVSYLPTLNFCTEPDCGWSSLGQAFYYTLNRPMWGLWVCWLILACTMGYGGFVNTFLSWNFFVPLSKLTYLGYLIHPMLCYLFFYRAPLQQYYTDYFFIYLFCGNLLIAMVLSFIMAFSVSAPLMGVIAVFLPGMAGKKK